MSETAEQKAINPELGKKLERNLKIYKWYKLDAFIFMGAVFVLYEMQTIGLTLTQVLIGESVFALTMLLLNIPTGVLSDLISRKKTLILGEIFLSLGVITFAFAQDFSHVIISQILSGIGLSTIAGSDSALIYDTLKFFGREHEHKKILSSVQSFILLTMALAQMLGGFMAEYDLRLPVIASIPFTLARLVIALFFTDAPKESHHARKAFSHAFSAMKWIFSRYAIFAIVIAMTIMALNRKISMHTFNPFLETTGLPVFYWGLLMGGFNLIAAFIAHKSHKIIEKIGEQNTFILIFGGWVIGWLLMARINITLAYLWPLIHWLLRPFASIFFTDEINKHTESHHRATVISAADVLGQASIMVALPIAGYLSDNYGLLNMYFLFGLLTLLVGVISGIMLFKPHKAEASDPAA